MHVKGAFAISFVTVLLLNRTLKKREKLTGPSLTCLDSSCEGQNI